jgi:hypothetical protein
MADGVCIDPNPDIAGIGVRVSIDVQALVNLAAVALFSEDGIITKNEYQALAAASNNIFITGCAILAASIIQATTYGLTVYYALVLNLGWINGLSASVGLLTSGLDSTLSADEKGAFEQWLLCSAVIDNPTKLGFIQVSWLGGLGIWVWSHIDTFGHQAECTPKTFFDHIGHNVAAANRPLRVASLILYSIITIPILNICFLIFWVVFLLPFWEPSSYQCGSSAAQNRPIRY